MLPNRWTLSITIFVCFCLLILMFQNCSPQQFDRIEGGNKVTLSDKCLKQDDTQDGTPALPWNIDSCACLQAIQTMPRDALKSHSFKIINDLNCSTFSQGDGFAPITEFSGNLNGQNFTISNLTSRTINAGLFINNNGTIENLKINNANIDGARLNDPPTGTDGNAGIVCGGDFCNGVYKNIMISNATVTGSAYSGGLVSAANDMSAENISLTNTNIICSDSDCSAGGITGLLRKGFIKDSSYSGRLSGSRVGGIAASSFGQILNTTTQVAYNGNHHGSIVGGVVGLQTSSPTEAATILNSHAILSVDLKVVTPTSLGSTEGVVAYIGGVVGFNAQNPNSVYINSIENSIATVDIYFETFINDTRKKDYIGGLVGVNQNQILNSSASGTIRSKNANHADAVIGSQAPIATSTGNSSTVQVDILD